MKLLTFLSFQALLIALLCSSTCTQKRIATLDGLIKLLGSLYQHKLFSLRDDAKQFEHLGHQFRNGPKTKPGLLETITFPRQYACMKSIPYCVAFYATMNIVEKTVQIKPKRKNIRNRIDVPCFSNIELGPCPDNVTVDITKQLLDVSKLKINDFCVYETATTNGTLDVFSEITQDSTFYLEIYRHEGSFHNRRSSRCMKGGEYCYIYNTCDFINRDNCDGKRNSYDNLPFPCFCPIEPGTYDMSGYKKVVSNVDQFGFGRKHGFVVVESRMAQTCFSFAFTGRVGP